MPCTISPPENAKRLIIIIKPTPTLERFFKNFIILFTEQIQTSLVLSFDAMKLKSGR